jgi:hypothetical protein
MANLIRCKACGYVARDGSIKDVCPACGVPATMFESFIDKVSDRRRRLLGLHSHPILVHFPEAFTVTLFILIVSSFFAPPVINESLYRTIQVLSFLLPFFMILALLTGLFDGKIRFRKVTTPFLKMKIIIGLIFLIISIGLAVIAFSGQLSVSSGRAWFALLTIIALGCGVLLGLIGGRLLEAKFPG